MTTAPQEGLIQMTEERPLLPHPPRIGLHRDDHGITDQDDEDEDFLSVSKRSALQNLSKNFWPPKTELVEVRDDDGGERSESKRNGHRSSSLSCEGSSGHERRRSRAVPVSLRRRIFHVLTDPETSVASAIFFVILIFMIFLSNLCMTLQTMEQFRFHPDDCVLCGGDDNYYNNADDTIADPGFSLEDLTIPCVCPPLPVPEIMAVEDALVLFFTLEWSLRVLCFEPPSSERKRGAVASFLQWLSFLTETSTVLDALAIFPYYIERFEQTNGLLTLRLLRLFRVFQLVRLGKYNATFTSLTNCLYNAVLSLNLLIIVLVFGAAFFGSMIYWLEKGEWKYTEYTDPPSFMYVRTAVDGVSEEPSPFTSIPASFWWFLVTVTTVGYGDTYPTSFGGKCVAAFAMLAGVLVIAFPVSVFSDLWSKELEKVGALDRLQLEDASLASSKVDVDGPVDNVSCRDSRRYPRNLGALDSTDKGAQKDILHPSSEMVILNESDYGAIQTHLRSIEESQNEIRQILGRCKVSTGASSRT